MDSTNTRHQSSLSHEVIHDVIVYAAHHGVEATAEDVEEVYRASKSPRVAAYLTEDALTILDGIATVS